VQRALIETQRLPATDPLAQVRHLHTVRTCCCCVCLGVLAACACTSLTRQPTCSLLPSPRQYPPLLDPVRWSSGLPRFLLSAKGRRHGLAAGAQLPLFRTDTSGLKAALQELADSDWDGAWVWRGARNTVAPEYELRAKRP
jgi:hypothetical protein